MAVPESLERMARGHSITPLLQQLPASIAVPGGILEAVKELSRVYLNSRYPDQFASGSPCDYFTEETSQVLISHARAILEWCRSKIH